MKKRPRRTVKNHIRLYTVLFVALLLGACSSNPNTSDDTAPGAAVKDETPEPTNPSVATADTQHVAMVVPPPLMPVPKPGNLMGYNTNQLESLFGTPTFMRRDPPAQLWQYQIDACVLDLYLYDNGNGQYAVTHLEFREVSIGPEATEHCIRQIVTRITDTDAG